MREATVTSAFSIPERASAVAALPNTETPWTGLIAVGLVTGGIDVFNIDGLRVMSVSGPQLTSLAAIGEFPIRGETFPLVFGADLDGRLRVFAVVRAAEDVIELPLEGDDTSEGIFGVCVVDQGIGYFDLALLEEGRMARIVRIQDEGGVGLSAETIGRLDLPFPARNCAGEDDYLAVSAPTTGVGLVDADGRIAGVQTGIRADDIAYSTLLGRPVALSVSSETGQINAFDGRTLEPIVDLVLIDGLNAPGFQNPSGLALAESSFGGMAFSSGIVAVYDRGDDRVKVVAREVISRAVIGPGD